MPANLRKNDRGNWEMRVIVLIDKNDGHGHQPGNVINADSARIWVELESNKEDYDGDYVLSSGRRGFGRSRPAGWYVWAGRDLNRHDRSGPLPDDVTHYVVVRRDKPVRIKTPFHREPA